MVLPCEDYIDIDEVYTLDSDRNATSAFLPNRENKTIYLRTTVTDPFGGYDIEWVNLTLEAPNGTVIADFDNKTMEKTYGYYNSYESRYELKWNYSGYPDGRYNVSVRGVDKNGIRAWHDSGGGDFGGHAVYGYHDFLITSLDYYVNFKIVDDLGNDLPNTKVVIEHSGQKFTENKTDSTGLMNVSLAGLQYEIEVMWEDVEVGVNRTIDVEEVGNRSGSDPYMVKANVFYPTVQVLDQGGNPVSDANIYVGHPNGTTSITPLKTGQNGLVSLIQAPGGVYSFEVTWKGTSVGSYEEEVTSSGEIEITVDIYELDVSVVDNAGDPVPDALVVFEYNDTGLVAESGLTPQNGSIQARLPASQYNIVVYWRDAVVYDETYLLTGSDSITLNTNIYQATVQVIDNQGAPLSGATVTSIYEETDKKISTKQTNEQGEITARLTTGIHRFKVDWMGVEVANETRDVAETNTDITITADVFHFNIYALDSTPDSDPLSNASVSVDIGEDVVDTGSTNDQGMYVSKLPQTEISVSISWKGIEVYDEEGINVDENSTELEAACAVYQLDVTASDSHDETVSGVQLTIQYGSDIMSTGVTNDSGEAHFRLPVPDNSYSITGSWRGVKVADSDYTMVAAQNNNTLDIQCSIYYLTVNVEDTEGEKVTGASVGFSRGGDNLVSMVTDEEGRTTARLPESEIHMVVNWRGFQVGEKTLLLDSDNSTTITADIYHVTWKPVDSQDSVLDNAELTVSQDGDTYLSGRTPESGEISIVIPGETFKVEVEWKGVPVYSDTETIDANEDIELSSDVYYLTLRGVDAKDKNVSGLIVTVYHDQLQEGQDLITSVMLDDVGTIKAPAGELRLTGRWKGYPVAEGTVQLDADMNESIECQIYYLDMSVEDSENMPLDGATVVVKDQDGNTFVTESTDEGVLSPRLPTGTWNFKAYWMGEMVGNETVEDLSQDSELNMTTSVHYIRVKATGQDGAVKGVTVTLMDEDGNSIMTNKTDSKGKVTFEQIPEGDYKVKAKLKKTQMMTKVRSEKNKDVSLTSSRDISFEFDGYPKPFTSTNMFYSILAFLLIGMIGIIAIAKKKGVI